MAISIKQAVIELEGLARKNGIEDNDRLANMVFLALKKVQKKVGNSNELRNSYQSNNELINVLPYSAHELIDTICQCETSGINDKAVLNDLIDVYRKAFDLMGISPKIRSVLF